MLNSLGIVLYSLSIVLNILYLFWICNAAYNIECILTTSLSNRPKKHRNVKRKKRKLVCKIKQKLSYIRTTEKGWKIKLASLCWSCFIFLECFIFVIIFANYYFSVHTPGFRECFLPMINYPVQIQFVPALCSEFCILCDADTLRAWTIKFNFVTGTEHISDKCLSSEWRLLDELQVYNGPLKNMSVLPGWEKWEKHSKQRDHGYTWGKPHLFMWQTASHLIKHICGSSTLIHKMELTCRIPWIHILY